MKAPTEVQCIHFGELYRHFKGKVVMPLTITKNTHTNRDEVLYYCISSGRPLFTRELRDWFSTTDDNGIPIKSRTDNVTGQEYRFVPLEAELKEELK